MITAAPTSPVTCERDPAWSATAVRDPLVLTGKPWKSPAAMLAAPMPTISWLPWTRSPRRAANADAVDIVSASATTAIATAPRNSSETSDQWTVGMVNGGKPWGSTPIVLDVVVLEVPGVDHDRGEDDDDEHRGDLRQQPRAGAGCRPATRCRSPQPWRWRRLRPGPDRNALASSIRPSASTENPISLGSWPITIVSARPFM